MFAVQHTLSSLLIFISFLLPALSTHVPTQSELPEELACFAKVAHHFLGYDYQFTRLMGVVSIQGLIELDSIFSSFQSRLSSIPPGNVTIQQVSGFPFFNHIQIAGEVVQSSNKGLGKISHPVQFQSKATYYTIPAHVFFNDAEYYQIPFFNSRFDYPKLDGYRHVTDTAATPQNRIAALSKAAAIDGKTEELLDMRKSIAV